MIARAPRADVTLLFLALVLSAFGVLMVYSAGQTESITRSYTAGLWIRQLQWLGVAAVGAFVISRISLRFLDAMAWPIYLLAVFLLVLTIVGLGSGAGTAEGTTSWLTIGSHRIGQPSELAKVAVVLLVAKVLAARKDSPASLLELWKPGLIIAVPGAIILKQGDLGTALVFLGLVFAMLFWAGVKWQLLLFLASPVVSLILAVNTSAWGIWFIAVTLTVIAYRPFLVEGIAVLALNVASGISAEILWGRLSQFRRNRLLTFVDPERDPLGAGYNVIQSKTAIGSGGWFGQGFNEGTQKSLSFLPEQPTDFIFAVLGEELGFIGVTIALALFLALFLRTTRIASRAQDSFSGLVAFGLTSVWFVHVLINVGMTINLMPVTGIPLPFFSYGGSFLLACWLSVGVLHRISVDGRGVPDFSAL